MKVILASVMGLIGYFFSSQLINDFIGKETVSPGTEALLGYLPIVVGSVVIVGCSTIVFGAEKVYYILKWNDLGKRMKAAYSAKFGGENPAFNTEVDLHIAAARTLGKKSWTKDVNVDWVKRMCEFVEIPFIVPEEEHLSEKEKTEMFGGEGE